MKTYVTGPRGYRGYPPGATVELELSEDEERRALERGSITVAKQRKKEEDEDNG